MDRKISGREKLKRYNNLIEIIIWILRKLPRKIIILLWKFINNWKGYIGIGLRYCVIKVLAKECGDNVFISHNVEIKNMNNLKIGNNVSIHSFSYIDAQEEISIGNNVSIAHNCSILDFDHTWDNTDIPIKYNKVITSPVKIMDDVWIGCGSRILSGVIVNERSVIAAGAVVNKTVESRTVVGGVPAKKIKSIK